MSKQVKSLGEALSVFVQIAELAQAKGILSFDDAIITKSAIDFVAELSKQAQEAQEVQAPEYAYETAQDEEFVNSIEVKEPAKARRSAKAKATSTEG